MTGVATIAGRMLHPGSAVGQVLRLDAPVSFWGGVDRASGRVVDRAHPQHDVVVTGTVLAMEGSRGSSGTPGVLAEMLRLGTGPRAIVLTKPDTNLVAGALVAETLYGANCPVVLVDAATFGGLRTGDRVRVGEES